MVYRVYVEKREGLRSEAAALLAELRVFLGLSSVTSLRLIHRYDVEDIDEELFARAVKLVFSEPQVDLATTDPPDGVAPLLSSASCLPAAGEGSSPVPAALFAVESLPGQFDQRADSAAQCIQILSGGERPTVRYAKLYALAGELSPEDIASVKRYVINPVECREASLSLPDTLRAVYPKPPDVPILAGFRDLSEGDLSPFIDRYALAMDADDLRFCRDYFAREGRDPTLTELRLIDTYWSDHCRHTTFLTVLDHISLSSPSPLLERALSRYREARRTLDRRSPETLMDMATIGAKLLRAEGKLENLDLSEEINACTVKIKVDVDGESEDWLLLFKNETHNHPTEIEPFGGAATCIGGAIRDPLSGRAYVYAAMRLTGAADPTAPLSSTLPGKLPQRKIVTTAAAGYSSYGNQIGLSTGIVDELYHPGYAAKRMEIGAVIGAVPRANVRREKPLPGDRVIVLGGRTGRDGCGGATGSSKSHTAHSLERCGAEVQKGNAPEERKLQRLFRNPAAARMIKRCNDFGAGGVSVAIGELADGLDIDLDVLPKKYDGLDGTELAISESQERMAVVVSPEDVEPFLALAAEENLECTPAATVTASPRMRMRWRGKTIVDLSRDFLSSNGAEKHADVLLPPAPDLPAASPAYLGEGASFADAYRALVSDLNVCSKRGLAERFDSTIGAGSVLAPFGGVHRLTPAQAMVTKISLEEGETSTCSLMSWGFNPSIAERSPYHAAYLAVIESISKLVAAGADFAKDSIYLTFQEYMEKPGADPARRGKPAAALLGAFAAQLDLGVAAIGGKDSMSGSFESLDVPPTLVSFAVTTDRVEHIATPEFEAAGHRVLWLRPTCGEGGLPDPSSLRAVFARVAQLLRSGRAVAAFTPTYGGAAEAVFKMAIGNGIGFAFAGGIPRDDLFSYAYGSFLLELSGDSEDDLSAENFRADILGRTRDDAVLTYGGERVTLSELLAAYEGRLEGVYPLKVHHRGEGEIDSESPKTPPVLRYNSPTLPRSPLKVAKPRVLIPVFPGTNCEFDSARAFREAGALPEVFVFRNLTPRDIAESVDAFARHLARSQIVFLPGGFSGGDEPDGSGKFITAFFRSPAITEGVRDLLQHRDGLIAGICNGFQALIKLGLVPYGDILEPSGSFPTLTFNEIGRHQSRIVRTAVASNKSPWLAGVSPGEVVNVPISHGEGRFLCEEALLESLARNGQIATQYVDERGKPSSAIRHNPNGSAWAVEGITSPDGRVLGKMGHTERTAPDLYKNIPGNTALPIFKNAVRYYE